MLAVAGCAPSLLSVKGIPTAQLQPIAQSASAAPCAEASPVAHPHLAKIQFEDWTISKACAPEFRACFTPTEWKQLIDQMVELEKESGR